MFHMTSNAPGKCLLYFWWDLNSRFCFNLRDVGHESPKRIGGPMVFAVQLLFPHFGRPALKGSLPRTVFLRLFESCGTLAIQWGSQFWPSKLHRNVCSQCCVSHDGAQKAFVTHHTSMERSAHVRVMSTVRHTWGKAFHWLRFLGKCCTQCLEMGKYTP